jgi:aryl-alcohol dehydrogenase-like predicted oxidoreductase
MTALALGTVQFGMNYGIAGRGEAVPATEVRDILGLAWEAGIRTLDTASAYGDIEERLGELIGGRDYRVVSKIPAFAHADNLSAASFVRNAVSTIRARLGERLEALLFHRGDDLNGPLGDSMWDAAIEAIGSSATRLGVSCYTPAEVVVLSKRFPIAVTQIPGSALDQRLYRCPLDQQEVHLRSIFLQGLLLLTEEEAAARAPRVGPAIAQWHRWCGERGITPLRAALGIAKGLPGVRYCVVGVDRAAHLEEIVNAWSTVPALQAPDLASDDIEVIDPRRWRASHVDEPAKHRGLQK